MTSPKIITTGDGSHSLLNTDLNETYHSVHGALRESQHVFIEKGLAYWMQNHGEKKIHVLEVGFGTGLNALLTLLSAVDKKWTVVYESLEAYPITADIWTNLNYGSDEIMRRRYEVLHELSWNEPHVVEQYFTFTKHHTRIQDKVLQGPFDLIYYDAFAPSKQPEMWTLDILKHVCSALSAGGVFVTYCAKGQLKRDLRQLGLTVETLPGPPGKKEMVRAVRA